MGLETASYVGGLDSANPTSTDPKSQGDDHLRLLKAVLLNTFAGFSGMVIVTGTEAQGATASDYTVTVSPAPAAYTASMLVVFKSTHANTGAATVQVNALGTKPLLAVDGTALKSGDIENGGLVAAFYDGTSFYLMSANDRADRNGETYSGSHDFTNAVTVVSTQPWGDNTTKAASTAYADAIKAYADALAFSTALPVQAGNKGKRVKTDGATASWDWSGIRLAALAGETMSDSGSVYAIMNGATYTLPDITGSGAFGLLFPTNAVACPSSVTTSDGWSLSTGAVAGTLKMMAPASVETAHGVWPGSTMTPPTLATIVGTANHTVIGTVQLDTNLAVVIFRDPTGTSGNVYAIAVNTATNAVGAVLTVGSWAGGANAASAVIYADSTSSFVCGFAVSSSSGGRYKVWACSVDTSTLVITPGTGVVTAPSLLADAFPPIKLANGLYAVSHAAATELVCFTVTSVTTITMGAAVASGTNGGGARIARVSNTDFLAVYCAVGGGTNGSRQLVAKTFTVTGTVPAPNAAATGSNIYADDIRVLKAFAEGSAYLVCCKDGAVSTTGNYHGITVNGTTTTLGAISAQATNLPAAYREVTYTHKPAEAIILYDSSTMLLGHLATGPFAIGITGSTLTVGASGGPATTVNFLNDTESGANFYGVGAAAFDKLLISGTTVSSAWHVAATPNIIQSDTLNNKAVSYNGTWFAWTLPTMQAALKHSKWLYPSGNNLIISGPIT